MLCSHARERAARPQLILRFAANLRMSGFGFSRLSAVLDANRANLTINCNATAGLRQHAPHHAVMHVQLAGDGAHRPFLRVVVAQDLRLDVRRCRHGRVPSARVAASLDDGRGGAGTPGGQDRGTGARTSGSAGPVAGVCHPRQLRRSRSSASQAAANHRAAAGVNRDASRSCRAPGSDAPARHGRAAPGGWSGSAAQQRAACSAGLVARSLRRSRSAHGRRRCI